jgi:PhnB protein
MVRDTNAKYHTATSYLICDGAAEAIDIYGRALGAVEMMRMPMPDGSSVRRSSRLVTHVGDENAETGLPSPRHYRGTPVSVLLYVENADVLLEQAVSSWCEGRAGS